MYRFWNLFKADSLRVEISQFRCAASTSKTQPRQLRRDIEYLKREIEERDLIAEQQGKRCASNQKQGHDAVVTTHQRPDNININMAHKNHNIMNNFNSSAEKYRFNAGENGMFSNADPDDDTVTLQSSVSSAFSTVKLNPNSFSSSRNAAGLGSNMRYGNLHNNQNGLERADSGSSSGGGSSGSGSQNNDFNGTNCTTNNNFLTHTQTSTTSHSSENTSPQANPVLTLQRSTLMCGGVGNHGRPLSGANNILSDSDDPFLNTAEINPMEMNSSQSNGGGFNNTQAGGSKSSTSHGPQQQQLTDSYQEWDHTAVSVISPADNNSTSSNSNIRASQQRPRNPNNTAVDDTMMCNQTHDHSNMMGEHNINNGTQGHNMNQNQSCVNTQEDINSLQNMSTHGHEQHHHESLPLTINPHDAHNGLGINYDFDDSDCSLNLSTCSRLTAAVRNDEDDQLSDHALVQKQDAYLEKRFGIPEKVLDEWADLRALSTNINSSKLLNTTVTSTLGQGRVVQQKQRRRRSLSKSNSSTSGAPKVVPKSQKLYFRRSFDSIAVSENLHEFNPEHITKCLALAIQNEIIATLSSAFEDAKLRATKSTKYPRITYVKCLGTSGNTSDYDNDSTSDGTINPDNNDNKSTISRRSKNRSKGLPSIYQRSTEESICKMNNSKLHNTSKLSGSSGGSNVNILGDHDNDADETLNCNDVTRPSQRYHRHLHSRQFGHLLARQA